MEDYPLTSPSSFYSVAQSFTPKPPLIDKSPQLENTHLPNSSFDDPPILPSTKHSFSHSTKHVEGVDTSHRISPIGDVSDDTSSNYSSMAPKFRSCDVYIGVSGWDPMMIRFVKWLRVELEMQGVSCFFIDRNRCRSVHDHGIAKVTMDVAAFGVVVITKSSFASGYSMEEIHFFLEKKKLVPIFFELQQMECTARDIIERKGDLWERYGGRLWESYGGFEETWRDAVNGLSRLNLKLEANLSNLRACVSEAVVILGSGLGRRRVVERVKSWKKLANEEFPFSRNANFVGRTKELHELELLLFGSIAGGEDGCLESRIHRNHGRDEVMMSERISKESEERSRKGKEPMVWVDSVEGIEVHEKGVACVTGNTGIGKTELLLEYAYRLFQRYKMILWVSGESRYLRQNYLKLLPILGIDTCMVNKLFSDRNETQSLEALEEEAIHKVRKELARDIPYLLVIDNLERENDWWDGRNIMDLLPRFGGATHVLISTRLPRIKNLKPSRLLYLSNAEAMLLMKRGISDLEMEEADALRIIEEKVGRLPFGLALVGAILSEFPMKPSKLLDTINHMPFKELSWDKGDDPALKHNPFLLQLLEFCLSLCDHEPNSLALRIVQASCFFPPSAVPASMLSLAGRKTFEEHHYKARFWVKYRSIATCMGAETSSPKSSEPDVLTRLMIIGIAKFSSKLDYIYFHDIVRMYAYKRGNSRVAKSVVRAIIMKASLPHHSDCIWAACFLLFKFENHQSHVDLSIHDLLAFIEKFVLPLATYCFSTYFRGNAALELLRLATEKLEVLEDSFLSEANNSLNNHSFLRGSRSSLALQYSPLLYKKFAHLRATLLETRAKIMLRGGLYDIGERLCKTAISIKEVIYGLEHHETASSREILERLVMLQSVS